MTVSLHLSAKALSLLAHSHVLQVSAIVIAHDPSGASRTTQGTVTLRLAKAKRAHKH